MTMEQFEEQVLDLVCDAMRTLSLDEVLSGLELAKGNAKDMQAEIDEDAKDSEG